MRAGAVEDDDFEAMAAGGFAGGGFEEVADDGFVGVEADAGVLQVDDDGVEVFQVFGFGALVGVFGAVEADDCEAGGGVGLRGRCWWSPCAPKMPCSGEKSLVSSMPGCLASVEDVDGAAALRVEAGLIGEQADAEMVAVAAARLLQGGEVGGFEDVDAGQELAVRRSRLRCDGASSRELTSR